MSATLRQWRAGPPNPALDQAIARLCSAEDVVHVAVMPDAHVAEDVCVGTVTATTCRLLPATVGSDIGCGMATVCLHIRADHLRDAHAAARVLHAFGRAVPPLMHPVSAAQRLPEELEVRLSNAMLESLKRREGRLELGTLGRGNHFLEVQRDDDDVLWLAVHSGSRCMGPAIRRHHEAPLWVHRKGAQRVGPGVFGIVPGSMGSPSYHVEGRGTLDALSSAAHGAGRALARGEARKRIRARDLDAQMRGIWFDARLRNALREEAPGAYKDIGEVMRAQRDLVRVVRRLEPVLVYKGA